MLLCGLSQRDNLVSLLPKGLKTKFLSQRMDTSSRRSFLTKVSWRTVQLGEITESSAKVNWTNKPEFVREIVRATEREAATLAIETPVKVVTESGRLGRFIEPP